ncbi:MAG: hypothetical protein Q8M29_02080 [Bacteroidota bacterium]|nr:hypothetical protein [Bacteroidota bacterium]
MLCRCSRNKLKAIYLTGGDLSRYGLTRKKSAEVIVAESNEPMNKSEDSQISEGPNIKLFQMLHGSAIGGSHALSGTE